MKALLEWLNETHPLANHGETRWRYRLPSLSELGGKDGMYCLEDGNIQYTESEQNQLDVGRIEWHASTSNLDLDLAFVINQYIDLERINVHKRALNIALDLDQSLHMVSLFSIDLDSDHTRTLAFNLYRALDHSLALTNDLAQSLARARDLALTLDRLAHGLNHNLYTLVDKIYNDSRMIIQFLLGEGSILYTLGSQVKSLPKWMPQGFQRLSASIKEAVDAIHWGDNQTTSSIQHFAQRLHELCQLPPLSEDQLSEAFYRGLMMRQWINQHPPVKQAKQQEALLATMDELITRALIGIARYQGWVEPFEEIYLVRERVD